MNEATQQKGAGASQVETREGQQAKSAELSVYDMNQFGPKGREHQIITRMYPRVEGEPPREPDTETYILFRDKPCLMPLEHAMKFLKDQAFKVVKQDGTRIQPIKQIDPNKPISQLANDEVIANLNELSRDSLFRRVKVLPGSEDIAENAKHGELVSFLVDWKKRQKKMSQGEQTLMDMMKGGALGGQMTPEMLESMFGNSRMVQ